MAGVKGRSGRRPVEHENHVRALAEMSIGWATRKFDSLPDADKLKVVLALAPKYIPTEISGGLDNTTTVVFQQYVKS